MRISNEMKRQIDVGLFFQTLPGVRVDNVVALDNINID